METYVERRPLPALAGLVRTVWVQSAGEEAYVQRHVPAGGVEIHLPIGGSARLVGPRTGPQTEVISPRTTVVGVRFWPGAAPLSTALEELVDQRVSLSELWGREAERLEEMAAAVERPALAVQVLQARVLRACRSGVLPDPLVGEAVRALMPWHRVHVDAVAQRLGLSASQLRRRCVRAVGTPPKVLQRILRLQGLQALAQAGAVAGSVAGLAGLAVDAGYADQAHLSRECVRLAGRTPRMLLSDAARCAREHDHVASYTSFFATRPTRQPG